MQHITKFIKIGNETFASRKRTSGGAVSYYFYHNDHLGGVNVITDIGGNRVQLNEYEPFGGVSRSEGSIDPTHRFTGQELDPETGLYYYGGRYYDQEIGRFVSPDPYVQAPDLPQNLNRYSYVLNNPQSYVDPSGHFIAIIVAIATVIAASLPEILTAEVITAQMVLKLAGQVISAAASTALMTQTQKTTRDAELNREHAKRQQDNLQQARPQQQNRLSQNPVGVDNSDATPWWHLGAIIRNVTEFTRVRRPDKDGYLTLGEAKWQWKHGEGAPVTVAVRKLDFSGLRVSDFPAGPGSLKLHTFQDWFDYIVHGTVTTELNADYTVSVLTDRFNFDIKPWLGNIKRNSYTILQRIYVGSGEPFPVYFEGSTPIAP